MKENKKPEFIIVHLSIFSIFRAIDIFITRNAKEKYLESNFFASDILYRMPQIQPYLYLTTDSPTKLMPYVETFSFATQWWTVKTDKQKFHKVFTKVFNNSD